MEMTALGIFLPPCHICAARNSRRSRVQTLSLYACQEDLKSKDIIRSKPHNQHTAEREGGRERGSDSNAEKIQEIQGRVG